MEGKVKEAGSAGNGAGADGAPSVVALRGVSRSFSEGARTREVLHSVDLDIAAGEFVALVGPSGSGKSTLLNLICGIDAPGSGSIRIAGEELTTMRERERTLFRRDRIGFVFQFFNLIPTLTVAENVLFTLELQRRSKGTERRAALELVDAVGLGDRLDSFPDVLSGGEQQRIAIARAFLKDAPLLILDEPTSALDLRSEATVVDSLERLMHGRTTFVVTHRLSLARKAAKIIALNPESLQIADSLDELLSHGPLYQEVYDLRQSPEPSLILENPSAT
jgi:putative ABC transport system ATP-binding protein